MLARTLQKSVLCFSMEIIYYSLARIICAKQCVRSICLSVVLGFFEIKWRNVLGCCGTVLNLLFIHKGSRTCRKSLLPSYFDTLQSMRGGSYGMSKASKYCKYGDTRQ